MRSSARSTASGRIVQALAAGAALPLVGAHRPVLRFSAAISSPCLWRVVISRSPTKRNVQLRGVRAGQQHGGGARLRHCHRRH
jgi:hypothetical protein